FLVCFEGGHRGVGEERHSFVGSEGQGQVEGFEPAFGGEVGAGGDRGQSTGLVVDEAFHGGPVGVVLIAKQASESCIHPAQVSQVIRASASGFCARLIRAQRLRVARASCTVYGSSSMPLTSSSISSHRSLGSSSYSCRFASCRSTCEIGRASCRVRVWDFVVAHSCNVWV